MIKLLEKIYRKRKDVAHVHDSVMLLEGCVMINHTEDNFRVRFCRTCGKIWMHGDYSVYGAGGHGESYHEDLTKEQFLEMIGTIKNNKKKYKYDHLLIKKDEENIELMKAYVEEGENGE